MPRSLAAASAAPAITGDPVSQAEASPLILRSRSAHRGSAGPARAHCKRLLVAVMRAYRPSCSSRQHQNPHRAQLRQPRPASRAIVDRQVQPLRRTRDISMQDSDQEGSAACYRSHRGGEPVLHIPVSGKALWILHCKEFPVVESCLVIGPHAADGGLREKR
jgi:hypothetical protein